MNIYNTNDTSKVKIKESNSIAFCQRVGFYDLMRVIRKVNRETIKAMHKTGLRKCFPVELLIYEV